jgi:hypothetical protein
VAADLPTPTVGYDHPERQDATKRLSRRIHELEVDLGSVGMYPNRVDASPPNVVDLRADGPAVFDVSEAILERARLIEGEREHPPHLAGRIGGTRRPWWQRDEVPSDNHDKDREDQ